MRKLLILSMTLAALFTAAPLFAAPRCRPEWTRFNCAVWQLGVDEFAAYTERSAYERYVNPNAGRGSHMSYEQFVSLTDIHDDIFWTAKGQELNQHSHDMQTLGPKLENYRGEVRALLFLRVISKNAAAQLINDSVEWEASMNAPRVWFGEPEAAWVEPERRP
jgi:hypothetical protein